MVAFLQYMNCIVEWTNDNSGFLTLLLFLTTLFLGWVSGIFQKLRYRSNFILELTAGPTFCCTFNTGKKYQGQNTHRTSIVIYLSIKNIGTAPSEIHRVNIGYHNHSFKYRFLWFWLVQTTSLRDFGHTIGENLRVYPFLIQKSTLLPQENITYLLSGQSSKGIVYFEQAESYGSFLPRVKNGKIKVKVKVFDVFNKCFSSTFWIPIVDLEYAKKFNVEFGNTLKSMEENKLEEWEI